MKTGPVIGNSEFAHSRARRGWRRARPPAHLAGVRAAGNGNAAPFFRAGDLRSAPVVAGAAGADRYHRVCGAGRRGARATQMAAKEQPTGLVRIWPHAWRVQ